MTDSFYIFVVSSARLQQGGRAALAALLAMALFGCGPKPSVSPPVETPETFSRSGDADRIDRWWQSFGDDDLNSAVDTALARNLSLRAAWEQLQAARAVADRERADLFPQIDASASAATERRYGDAVGRAPNVRDLEVGAAASYEIDLWGRVRARSRAEADRARATYADYQAASLSLSAEITRTWILLAAARQQVALAKEQLATNRQVLTLIQERFDTGQIRSVDVLRQRQAVAASQEDLAAASADAEVVRNQLAVLLGRSPAASVPSGPSTLPDVPPAPTTGVPADLVHRRPDVQAARLQARAAAQDLSAAMSDRYPRLTLTASAATSAQAAEDLFDNWVAGVAGDLLAPIFYGGRLQAEVDRTTARRNELVFRYGQTVLQAFREVEDALVLEARQREQVTRLEEQADLAQQAYDQLRIQYLNGEGSYLDVLTALRDLQQLQRALITGRRLLLEDRIALYRALAGSFTTERERDAS